MDHRDQTPLQEAVNPLSVCGVVYAIVHLHTSKVYVGHTINSAHHRLIQHYQKRNTEDNRTSELHKFMRLGKFNSFITWPLEYIPKSMYTIITEGKETVDATKFRAHAVYRELFWYNRLRTQAPRGLNAVPPASRPPCRRAARHDRWNERPYRTALVPNHACARISDDGKLVICDHTGNHSRVRQHLIEWVELAKEEGDALRDRMLQSSPGFRSTVNRWIAENVPPRPADDPLLIVVKLIAELRTDRADFPRAEEKDPFNLVIKLVHSHEILQIINLAQILHSEDVRSKFPNSVAPVPRICHKQVPASRHVFCNFTQHATTIPNPMPPEEQHCPCRLMLPLCTDLPADGHVMSTDYCCIPNNWFRQQLMFGQRFRANLSIETVMTAVEQGLTGYLEHYDQWVMKNNRPDMYFDRLPDEWKAAVLAAVQVRLENNDTVFASRAPSAGDKKFLKRFKQTFTVSPVSL